MLPAIGKDCLFCHKALKALEPLGDLDNYIHSHCPTKCCKVMTSRAGDWILFRIRLDEFSSIEIDKRKERKFLYRHVDSNDIYLPLFDIKFYSLLEIKNKVKKYLLFS